MGVSALIEREENCDHINKKVVTGRLRDFLRFFFEELPDTEIPFSLYKTF